MPDGHDPDSKAPREGWSPRLLGELVEKVAKSVEVHEQQTYREIGIRSHGKGIFHKDSVIGDELGTKRVFWVTPGALTFNIVFAWEGAVAVTTNAEKGMIASHRFPMFVPRGERIVNVDFLRRFFQTRLGVRLLGEASPGGAGRNRTLNQDLLGRITVPIPPIGEQQKIAAILSAVDDTIEKTQAVIDQLHVVKKALMSELLTRGIPGRHTKFKQTEVGEVPESWNVVSIGEIADLGSGKTPPRDRPEFFSNEQGHPWVKTMDLNDGLVMATNELVTDTALQEAGLKLNAPGTVLVAMYGGFAQIGRSGVLGVTAATNQAICTLKVDRARLLPNFCNYWLVGNRERWRAFAASSRKDPNITKRDVQAFPIALPPLFEQEELVCRFSAIDSRQELEDETHAVLTSVKSALMSVLLTGKVRVKPDTDEATT